MASDDTFPATLPNFIAYRIPSKTSGFACPAEEWDKELDIIKELKAEEFLDFIKADFGLSNMIKLATHHPKLAVRQLFNLVKGKN